MDFSDVLAGVIAYGVTVLIFVLGLIAGSIFTERDVRREIAFMSACQAIGTPEAACAAEWSQESP